MLQSDEMFTADFFVSNGIDKEGHVEGFRGDPINLFDTFLHSQDRAYTVDQIYKFVEDAGLQFNSFTNFNPSLDEKYRYRAELTISDDSVYERVKTLSEREQQAISEMFCANIGLHTFYVSFREKYSCRR